MRESRIYRIVTAVATLSLAIASSGMAASGGVPELAQLYGDPISGHYLGTGLAVYESTVVAGGYMGSPGAAYVFQDSSAAKDWSSFDRTTLTASDGMANDGFAVSVVIDGSTIAVGSPWDDDHGNASGSVYLFQDTSVAGDWSSYTETKITSSTPSVGALFGDSLVLDGQTLVVGAPEDGPGSVSIFQDTSAGGDWSSFIETVIVPSDGAAGDSFGSSLAMDGSTLVAGAFYDDDAGSDSGSVYLFQDTSAGGDWSSRDVTKILASDGAAGDWFGRSVAIEGSTLVVGATYDDDNGSNSGSVYLYRDNSGRGDWSDFDEQKIHASDAEGNDRFGKVALSGRALVVGASDAMSGPDPGAAYLLYDTSPLGDWSSYSESKFTAAGSDPGDWFGFKVGLWGSTIGVGACFNSDLTSWAGAAYVFNQPFVFRSGFETGDTQQWTAEQP